MITVQCFDAITRLEITTFKMPITAGKINVTALERALNASALLVVEDPKVGPVLIMSDSTDYSICNFVPDSVVKIHRLLVCSKTPI
jgi:hypothetical protein